jgi:hypothetical protein
MTEEKDGIQMPTAKDKYAKLYRKVWSKLDAVTPLMGDCGTLCGKKCCSGTDQDGMLLFPGEEFLYEDMDNGWFQITDSNIMLSGGYRIRLLVCKGKCPREIRPLSCRIFPIIPYINSDGRVEFRLDLRSLGICPVVYSPVENPVEEEFIEALYHAFPPLLSDDAVIEFIEMLSRQYDETAAFLSKFQRDEES